MTKCSSFCPPTCTVRHHPVLLSLMEVKCQRTLQKFKQTLRGYQITGFQLSMTIPDPKPTFRYPLLHWAAVLGKVSVIKMLIRPPFNIDIKSKSDHKESVLHRLLLFWNFQSDIRKISELLEILHDCISCTDEQKRTPLHVCANYLTSCSRKELKFWKDLFKLMINHTKNGIMRTNILNMQNDAGETILHILCKREELLEVVEYVLYCGVDGCIPNNANETALEISWRYALPIYNLLQMFLMKDEAESLEMEGERRTRTSLALSETKDYTQFFEVNYSSEEIEEENKLKRKVSESNISLVSESNISLVKTLENLSTNSPSQEKKSFKRRKRRRCVILSDSDSDNDIETMETKHNVSRCDVDEMEMNECNKLAETLNKRGICIDLQYGKTNEVLREEISHRMSAIRDMYSSKSNENIVENADDNSNHGNDSNDDAGYEADEESINLDNRIEIIQDYLKRMIA